MLVVMLEQQCGGEEREKEESPLTGNKYVWTLIATDVYVYLLTSLRMLCQKKGESVEPRQARAVILNTSLYTFYDCLSR